jgi:hypothetical protein
MFLTEAILELLAEARILTGGELKERVRELGNDPRLQFRWAQ